MLIVEHRSETLQTPSKAPKAAVHQVSTLLKLSLSIYPVSGIPWHFSCYCYSCILAISFPMPSTSCDLASLSICFLQSKEYHKNSYPVIISCYSVTKLPSFFCLQSFPASGSFPVSQLFTSGGQSIRASALASVLPRNTQNWSPLGWTGWISLQSKGLSRVFSSSTLWKNFLALSLLYGQTLTSVHDYWKNIALTMRTIVSKVMSLLFNTFRFVISWRTLITSTDHHVSRSYCKSFKIMGYLIPDLWASRGSSRKSKYSKVLNSENLENHWERREGRQ